MSSITVADRDNPSCGCKFEWKKVKVQYYGVSRIANRRVKVAYCSKHPPKKKG